MKKKKNPPATDAVDDLTPIRHLLLELRRLELLLSIRIAQRSRSGGDTEPLPAPALSIDESEVTERLQAHVLLLRAAVQTAQQQQRRLPLLELCRNLKLDGPSVGMLMLAAAPHLDRRFEAWLALLQGDATRTLPQVDLALQLFAQSEEDRLALRAQLAPPSPLLRGGFVRLVEPLDRPASSLLSHYITVTPRLIRFLLDQPGADEEVEAALVRLPLPPVTVAVSQALSRFFALLKAAARPAPIAVLHTEDSGAVYAGAAQLAAEAGLPTLLIDLGRPQAAAYAERCVKAAFAEAHLQGALLVIGGFDELEERSREPARNLARAELESFAGPAIIVTHAAFDLRQELRRRAVFITEVPLPDAEERLALLSAQLPAHSLPHAQLAQLASHFRLDAQQIRDAACMVAGQNQVDEPSLSSLRRACQVQSRHGLGELAQRVPPWGSWDGLVLPPASIEQLHRIIEHVEQRETVFSTWGLGQKVSSWRHVTALFSGPPGTGKTLSASLIAQALGLDLFRIDLANIVSKYIGETEKNLDRVFRAAYRSNAVLLFDEADSLFGKRTEVKDAHDRYANVETSYLLQKLESFEGLAILATNLKKNIDAAFLRRIDVMVDFPAPDPKTRLRLWTKLLPDPDHREPELDLEFLAQRFELSGGNIQTAIQTASLHAAALGARLSMKHLLVGVRDELHKQGKISTASDFGSYASVLDAAELAPAPPLNAPSSRASSVPSTIGVRP